MATTVLNSGELHAVWVELPGGERVRWLIQPDGRELMVWTRTGVTTLRRRGRRRDVARLRADKASDDR